MSILRRIAEQTEMRMLEEKRRVPLCALRRRAEASSREPFLFEKSLRKDGLSIIAEVKRASPSRGLIAVDFPYLDIAKEYAEAGADAISCLTEPFFFQGDDAYLERIASEVAVPVLRKDFTIDEYMVYQAKAMGADAVLLIAAILSREALRDYAALSRELGLSCIVECHDEAEIESAVYAGATAIGINNRNLDDFTVDIGTTARLAGLVPDAAVLVAESGVASLEDAAFLRKAGADAVLIGEALMRSGSRKEMIRRLKQA